MSGSDSESSSSSSSDGEDINTTGLIATRAKRSTAGNLYASLRANLDDEELQKELLAEDAEDVGDYEGSDKEVEDDEEAFESSSDEEDQGPPKEGEAEDLEGEKQLKKQERAEARKKRTLKDARLRIPGGLGRATKRVRLAEGVKGSDGEGSAPGAPKPKKKSERSNWLPTAEDGPVRQSGRSLAVANREVIHANLTASAARSEKQRRVMKDAAERDRRQSLKHAELTQEQRLKKCEKVERETSKELGRFEEEEAERQRLRDEALAAKRRRGVQGPVYRLWSGSCVWEGEKVRSGRVAHGSLNEDELQTFGKPKIAEMLADEGASGSHVVEGAKPDALPDATQPQQSLDSTALSNDANQTSALTAPGSWPQGMEQYAAQPEPLPSTNDATEGPPPHGLPACAATNASADPPPYQGPAMQPQPPPQQPIIYHGWPPGTSSFPPTQQAPPISAPLAPPAIREQAQRTLLMLEDFAGLAVVSETTKSSKRKSASANAPTATSASRFDPTSETFTPSPLQNLLLPDSYPPMTPTQSTYLLTKPRKKGLETTLPLAPAKARCALTQWEAKFRDPKTGVPYADLHAYKALQRMLSGGCAWSGTLGAWVGASMGVGTGVGRPAKGVPAGFVGGGGVGGKAVKSEGNT